MEDGFIRHSHCCYRILLAGKMITTFEKVLGNSQKLLRNRLPFEKISGNFQEIFEKVLETFESFEKFLGNFQEISRNRLP